MMNFYPRRLNLIKPNNVRDLGGYMRKDGNVTKYGQFLRSDLLSGLPNEDIQFLVDYGVKTVFDLRSEKELKEYPSSLTDVSEIKYLHYPLLSEHHPQISERFTIGHLYLSMLESSENIGPLLNAMAEHSDGTILFNCTVGKDRTGITAAMLLMLAEVDRCDIIADYQVSYTYTKKFFDEIKQRLPEMPMHFSKSEPEFMENFIDEIENKKGGIINFLLEKNVTKESIQIIKNKLI